MPCVRTQHLVLAGIKLTIIWAINSADDKFFIFFFFITKKTGFDISCNGDNLHETQILFSWKNEKNISKCRLLKILPSAKRYGLHKKSRMSLCMAKPTIKLVRRDGSACICTLILHISSLIRAFANRMCLLQSLG